MTDRQIKIGIFRLAHPFIIFDRALTGRRINASDQATLHCERRGQMAYWKLSLLAVSGYSSACGEGGTYEPEAGMD
jgi:hypothetical protein